MSLVARRDLLKHTGATVIGGAAVNVQSIDVASAAQEPSADWQQTYGGAGRDAFRDFVQTSDSGYLVVGEVTTSKADVTSAFVVKLDPIGQPIHKNRDFPMTDANQYDERLNAILLAGEKRYLVAGRRTADGAPRPGAVLVESGNDARWVRTEPEPGEFHEATHADDGFVLAGQSRVSDSTGNRSVALLTKYRTNGSVAWRQTFSGEQGDATFNAVVPGSDGGFIAAGSRHITTEETNEEGSAGWIRRVDKNGQTMWDVPFLQLQSMDAVEFFDLIPGPSGGYLAVGEVVAAGANSPDAFALKIDASGKKEWGKRYNKSKANGFRSGFFRNEYFVGGYNATPDDWQGGWVAVFGPDGSETGQASWGKAGDSFHAALNTAEGNEAFVGTKQGADGWMVYNAASNQTTTVGGDETVAGTPEGSDGVGSSVQDATGTGSDSSSSGNQRKRGFFTNNGDGLGFLSNVFNLTVLGFLLSVAGIIHQMIQGQ